MPVLDSSPLPPSALGPAYILFNGPMFIGSILNWALLGTVTLQVFAYFRANFRDAYWIQGLVVAAYIVDILQTVFSTNDVWYLVILHWGDPVFEAAPWTSATFPITTGISAVLVQIFFAWRIWTLGRHWIAKWVAVLIVLTGLMQCLSGIIFGIRSLHSSTIETGGLHAGSTVWLGGAAACDILIVVAMLFILHSVKRPTKFLKTKGLIDRLMIQTIESGAVTAAAATAELILTIVFPQNYLYSVFVLILGKLYSNVLLANLNGRQRYCSRYAVQTDASNILTRIDLPDQSSDVTNQQLEHNPCRVEDTIEINVLKQVHVDEGKSVNMP